jgi:tRNA(fMet)-specific endonuclease VapC
MEYGLRVANNGDKPDIEKLCKFIFTHSIYQIDNNVAKDHYSDLRAKLFAKYSPKTSRTRYHKLWQWKDPIDESELGIQENDLWIASVAMNYNLILVTADKMDRINSVLGSGLEIENWSLPL